MRIVESRLFISSSDSAHFSRSTRTSSSIDSPGSSFSSASRRAGSSRSCSSCSARSQKAPSRRAGMRCESSAQASAARRASSRSSTACPTRQ